MSCEEIRDQLSEGWLEATDFGRFTNTFKIKDERPPRDRIRLAYQTPEARAIILNDPFLKNGEWEGSEAFDNWDVMVALTGMKLTEQDAEYAVGLLVEEVTEFVKAQFIPFLSSAGDVRA